jgi:Na+/proline symporter
MAEKEDNVFLWPDYLVFSIMLFISATIGFVFGWFGRKKKSSKEFLLGGGDLHVNYASIHR